MGPARPGLINGTPLEVLLVFLKLGLTSFGGPVAHLGYFRAELVQRRGWLDERAYAELVGLCQFLPGPASSQVGFALGLARAGYAGAVAAWVGFTLPSAVLLALLAAQAGRIGASPAGTGALHGLKLVAVAVVAQAVWGMARTLCPDRLRAGVALAGLAVAAGVPGWAGQVGAVGLGAAAGMALCRDGLPGVDGLAALRVSRWVGAGCLVLFAGLLVGAGGMFGAFYRAGALVFGGGHVVLPALRDAVVAPGWVAESVFLAGYGAAQAVPGPLFTVAAYLGAEAGGVAGAAIALVAIFLPGLLLLLGVLPFWGALRRVGQMRAAVQGANAAVVGVLAAALYDPVWLGGVGSRGDFAAVAAGFVALVAWRTPPLLVVALGVLGGMAAALA